MDLIDRQAVIDEIDEWIKAFRENGHKESAADACLIQDGIIQLPSAQPEREKGEWIEFNSYDGKYDIIKCPYCKHIFTIDSYHWTDIGFVKDDFKFCPNCGERWKEEHETD